MVNPLVRKNEMYFLDIVYDELKYYQDCEEWHLQQAAYFKEQKEKAIENRRAGTYVQTSMVCPVRDQLPMAMSCESFYVSLLYHLARIIDSIESLNALMNDILHYNKGNYLGWMHKQIKLMMIPEAEGGLVCNCEKLKFIFFGLIFVTDSEKDWHGKQSLSSLL